MTNVMKKTIIIIIITRPWPAFGQQGQDRSSDGNNDFCDPQTDRRTAPIIYKSSSSLSSSSSSLSVMMILLRSVIAKQSYLYLSSSSSSILLQLKCSSHYKTHIMAIWPYGIKSLLFHTKKRWAESTTHEPWGLLERIQKDFWFWQSLGVL